MPTFAQGFDHRFLRGEADTADEPATPPRRPPLFRDARSLELLARVERIARSDASALICGESGTGKELIARLLHERSGRRGPFVAVNCGAFSETLIDAELFGHESGAYTGAGLARAGWFEAANGGTLFLDEIGELPLHLQVKLLRVLQERQVVRLGSRRPVTLDIRLVAATHIDLERAVKAQRFRSDLYYRISVAPIEVPPLRERPDDILPLARHFIGLHGARMGRDATMLAPDAQEALLDYGWPGNVRELENVMQMALIGMRGPSIRAGDLRLDGHELLPPSAAEADERDADGEDEPQVDAAAQDRAAERQTPEALASTLVDTFGHLLASDTPALFRQIEQSLVRTAFAHSGDNQVRTAHALGVTRNTLRTLLKRHGLLDRD